MTSGTSSSPSSPSSCSSLLPAIVDAQLDINQRKTIQHILGCAGVHKPVATTGTAEDEPLLASVCVWVGVFGWLGVCGSLVPSGCGYAVADAVADALGPGRPGVLGAVLSEEHTSNCCVVIMNSNFTWGRRLWCSTISPRHVKVHTLNRTFGPW